MKKEEKANSQPWGFVAGLLIASFATLVGIGSGLEPDTILLRAGIAGTVVGIIVSCAVCLGSIFSESV